MASCSRIAVIASAPDATASTRRDHPAQRLLQNLARGGVVVDDEHAEPGELRRHTLTGLLCGTDAQPEREIERRADARLAFEPDATAHQLHQPAADGEAQAGAAVLARRRHVGLGERLEQLRRLLVRHPDPGVAHGTLQLHFLARAFELFDVDPDFATVGELHGVVDAIGQDLGQANRIAEQVLRDARRDVHQELESLLVGLLRRQRRHRADDVIELEVGGLEVEPASLNLGEVEDVVDDRQQRGAGVVDLADVVTLLGRKRCLEGEMRQADDRVHRRADLVAHVREEHGLHLGGFLGLELGADELGRLFFQLVRLLPGLAEQLLGAKVSLQDVQAHGHHRQQFVEQGLLMRVEGAEGRHFENAEHGVLGHRRQRRGLERRRLAQTGGDAEVAWRKIRERGGSVARGRTGRPALHRAGPNWRRQRRRSGRTRIPAAALGSIHR